MNTKPLKLSKRFEIRCEPAEYARWSQRSDKLKLPSLSAYLRQLANVDTQPPRKTK